MAIGKPGYRVAVCVENPGQKLTRWSFVGYECTAAPLMAADVAVEVNVRQELPPDVAIRHLRNLISFMETEEFAASVKRLKASKGE